jgi:Mn-dependent DtxR family transcriptional regulator
MSHYRLQITPDRRPAFARAPLAHRIYSEFREMPALSLDKRQAARLMGVSADVSSRILVRLAKAGILRLTPDGRCRVRADTA